MFRAMAMPFRRFLALSVHVKAFAYIKEVFRRDAFAGIGHRQFNTWAAAGHGLGAKRKRRPPHHRSRRQRRPQLGMLVQVDGSLHRRLKDGGPSFCLVAAAPAWTPRKRTAVSNAGRITAPRRRQRPRRGRAHPRSGPRSPRDSLPRPPHGLGRRPVRRPSPPAPPGRAAGRWGINAERSLRPPRAGDMKRPCGYSSCGTWRSKAWGCWGKC